MKFIDKKVSNSYADDQASNIINIIHSSIILSKEDNLLTVEVTIKGKRGFFGFCKIQLIIENQTFKTYTVFFFRGKLKKVVEIPKKITVDSNCFTKVSLRSISRIEKVKIY